MVMSKDSGSTVVFEGCVNVCVGAGVSDGVGIGIYIEVMMCHNHWMLDGGDYGDDGPNKDVAIHIW